MITKFLKEDLLKEIIECLKQDKFYQKNDIPQIAYYTQQFVSIYYAKRLLIRDPFGIMNFFKHDERTCERDGLLHAQIKYAAHFVTSTHPVSKTRILDTSKAKNINTIREVIENADLKIIIMNKKNEMTYNYIYKKNNKNHIVVSKIVEEGGIITTFLPNQREKLVQNKIASAITTEAKTSTNQ